MYRSDVPQVRPCAEKRHLFLTGEKRVGKSTAIQTALAGFSGPVGGFCTRRVVGEGGKISVHLLTAGGETPCEANRLFFRGDAPELAAQRFDALGCAALEPRSDIRLILMDELGPKEQRALAFQQALFRVLDGAVPVLGVLQQADAPFLRAVAEHPLVAVRTVTEENRDEIPQMLQSWLP